MSASSHTRSNWKQSPRSHGGLKIYLGYAAGVGKTYQMIFDGHDAVRRGVDLVIGYFEPHDRQDTIALAAGLETVPRRVVEYRGHRFEEMDPEGILRRRPTVCLVDELAHTNVPGVENPKRWQDVIALLDAGMDVWTTMNVQHMESLNDQVYELTGVRVRETVPDWLVKQASEVVLVDLTPEALLNRLRRGAVYSPAMVPRALKGFFKESNLAALREIAMREAAHEVDVRRSASEDTEQREDLEQVPARVFGEEPKQQERILIRITADPMTVAVIRRGRRIADYLKGECLAVYVCRGTDFRDVPEKERRTVAKHLDFARNLQIETRILEGHDEVQELLDFARRNLVTQILVARTPRSGWSRVRGSDPVERLVRKARDLRVTVVGRRRRVDG